MERSKTSRHGRKGRRPREREAGASKSQFKKRTIIRMKAGFLEKLIERLGRIGPEDVQNYFLRLAQEKGFLETVFNAIQEGIVVTDSKGRITYLNDAACALFGLEAGEAIGKGLDERIGGLDWRSLTQSGGPVSHDVEIFYPQNRF